MVYSIHHCKCNTCVFIFTFSAVCMGSQFDCQVLLVFIVVEAIAE